MKKTVCILAGLFATTCLTPVGAADLRPIVKAPPPVLSVYDWTGLYVGGHVGISTTAMNAISPTLITPRYMRHFFS